jgi:hypothetical protein
MTGANPKKYEAHVFAIIRVETAFYGSVEVPVEHTITVTKVMWSLESAKAEVTRLNELTKDKSAFYFWQTTRLAIRDRQD